MTAFVEEAVPHTAMPPANVEVAVVEVAMNAAATLVADGAMT